MLRFVLALMALATLSHAGDGRGNGGDGVRLPSGRIMLYDLFEKGIDLEEKFKTSPGRSKPVWNHSIELEIKRIAYETADTGPLWKGEGAEDLIRSLTKLLDLYARTHPLLVPALLDELKPLRWAQASVDLVPNEDTKSALDPKKYEALGCARTELGTTLYSPSCAGKAMLAWDRASLVLHETFYLFYERLFGDLKSSLPIRLFVTALFNKDSGDRVEGVLEQIGMKEFLKEEKEVRELFFGGNLGYSSQIECSFENAWVKDFTLRFSGPTRLNGQIMMNKTAFIGTPTKQKIVGTTSDPEEIGSWVPLLPRFDLKKKEMRVELTNNDEERTLDLTFDYSGTKTVKANLSGNSEDEEYPFEFTGKCSRLD